MMDIGGNSAAVLSFTPVRRPEHSVSTRNPRADQEKEWTAARCHRLLRALTSRVALLKKDLARYQQQKGAESGSGAAEANLNLRGKEKTKDGDWAKSKKPVIRTYSTKGRKAVKAGPTQAPVRGRISILPGEVLISTPILSRARGEQQILEAFPTARNLELEAEGVKVKRRRTCYGGNAADSQFQLSGTLRDMRQNIEATRYSTYEGIYNGLETLIRTTTPISEGKTAGARSLLAMALRAVPSYITEQESLLQAHMEETGSKSAIENRDIAVEIYDELEAFGSSGFGWKRLRIVVRAHGVRVIFDAITAGLLEVDFCGTLISLCIHMNAVDEGQDLLAALLGHTKYSQPQSLHERLNKPISMLSKFTQHTGRASFQWRELSRLIGKAKLDLGWLATKEFGSVWTTLIQSLTPELLDDDALKFLETTLVHILPYTAIKFGFENKERGRFTNGIVDAVCNTYSSLLTTICSIVLLNRELEAQNWEGNPASSPGVSQLASLLQSCLAQAQVRPSAPGHTLLVFANLLVIEEANLETITTLTQSLQNNAHAVLFITQVSRCMGRGTSSLGLSYLQAIHLRLEVLSCSLPSTSANILKGLIVDSAFAFARKVPERASIEYAASMDATYCMRSSGVESSLLEMGEDNANESGYRWEEGIGEWVVATPAADIGKRKILREEEEDEETPFRPPKGLRSEVEQTPSAVTRLVMLEDDGDEVDELEGSSFEANESGGDLIHYSSPIRQEAVGIQSEDEVEASSPISLRLESDDELGSASPESIASLDSTPQSRCASSEVMEEDDSTLPDQPPVEDDDEDDPSQLPESSSPSSSRESELGIIHSAENSLLSLVSSSPFPASASPMKLISRTPRLGRKLFAKSYNSRRRNGDSYGALELSFASTASSSTSTSSRSGLALGRDKREWVDRAPRLGRRALRGSGNWGVCDSDGSGDELRFLSTSSQESEMGNGKRVLIECSENMRKQKVVATKGKPMTRKRKVELESADELGF